MEIVERVLLLRWRNNSSHRQVDVLRSREKNDDVFVLVIITRRVEWNGWWVRLLSLTAFHSPAVRGWNPLPGYSRILYVMGDTEYEKADARTFSYRTTEGPKMHKLMWFVTGLSCETCKASATRIEMRKIFSGFAFSFWRYFFLSPQKTLASIPSDGSLSHRVK